MTISISNPVTKYILEKIESAQKEGLKVDEIKVSKQVYIQLMIEQMDSIRIDKRYKSCTFRNVPLIIE